MIREYTEYLLKLKGYSYNTTQAYAKDIQSFAAWAKQHKTDARWSNIERADIDAYIKEQYNQGKKPSTTNRQLAAISSLYRYFQRQGLEVSNPCKYESRRKVAETIPNTISKSELQVAYKNSKGVAKFMIGLLSTTGIRIQEMLNLTWQDVNFEENSLRINGKGQKDRKVYTTAEVLAEAKQAQKYCVLTNKMFWFSQRWARTIIWEALKPYSKAKQLSPHAIRHTYATELAKQGENVTTIAKLLGHASIKTTQKYIDMTQVDTQRAASNINMLN